MKLLMVFIIEYFVVQLVVEELGGFVVGDFMEIDLKDFVGGFNVQGKLKKMKGSLDDDKCQCWLDEIWGYVEGGVSVGQSDEVFVVGLEMRELIEVLLNQFVEVKGDILVLYVILMREFVVV